MLMFKTLDGVSSCVWEQMDTDRYVYMTWYLPFKISIAKTDVFAIECLDQYVTDMNYITH